MNHRAIFGPVIIPIVLVFYGCGIGTTRTNDWANTYIQFKDQQNWPKALETVRAEIRDPWAPNHSGYLFHLHMVGISTLVKYAETLSADLKSLDVEALQYYRNSLIHRKEYPREAAEANNLMAFYFSSTMRNGLALPYHRKAHQFWLNTGNQFQIIRGFHGFANMFSDMGDKKTAIYYRSKALVAAQDYFKFGLSPTDAHEWLQYETLLAGAASSASERGDRDTLESLWQIMEPIVKKYLSPKSISYQSMAQSFAIAGDIERGRALLKQSKIIWGSEKKRFPQLTGAAKTDFLCAEGQIELEAENFPRASELLKTCRQLYHTLNSALADNMVVLKHHARSHQGMGNIDTAIDLYEASVQGFENLRSSFAVGERASFFNKDVAREAYWGLIETRAQRALTTQHENDFWETIKAMERIRARQFGELVKGNFTRDASIANLKGLAQKLDHNTAVVNYILTKRAIVLLAFSNNKQEIAITAYDRDKFDARIRKVHAMLADPDVSTSIAVINTELKAISKLLLEPVRSLIANKTKVVILQDGLMNIIPFGLLTLSTKYYRPLLEKKALSVVPSLKLLIQSANRKKTPEMSLFAVGDPTYSSQNPTIAGLQESEIREITRGSKFLQYFDRLPGTRKEIREIGTFFRGKRLRTLFGNQATESTIKAADLRPYRYIHLATHGILGGEVPGVIEPALVFADESGSDGLLTASEVSKMELNSDLTVLSACNTGSGEFVQGEGVLGMSRAFLLAGSRAVIVSLWSVADQETALLMKHLYRQITRGVPIAEALRKAALKVRQYSHHPIYWAPFILVSTEEAVRE